MNIIENTFKTFYSSQPIGIHVTLKILSIIQNAVFLQVL